MTVLTSHLARVEARVTPSLGQVTAELLVHAPMEMQAALRSFVEMDDFEVRFSLLPKVDLNSLMICSRLWQVRFQQWQWRAGLSRLRPEIALNRFTSNRCCRNVEVFDFEQDVQERRQGLSFRGVWKQIVGRRWGRGEDSRKRDQIATRVQLSGIPAKCRCQPFTGVFSAYCETALLKL